MPVTPSWGVAEELSDMLFGVDLSTRSSHELVELRAALVRFTDQVDAHLRERDQRGTAGESLRRKP